MSGPLQEDENSLCKKCWLLPWPGSHHAMIHVMTGQPVFSHDGFLVALHLVQAGSPVVWWRTVGGGGWEAQNDCKMNSVFDGLCLFPEGALPQCCALLCLPTFSPLGAVSFGSQTSGHYCTLLWEYVRFTTLLSKMPLFFVVLQDFLMDLILQERSRA